MRGYRVGPHPVVIAQHYGCTLELPFHIKIQILPGSESPELFCKRDNLNPVYTQVIEHPFLLVQRRKQPEGTCLQLKHIPGMRPECTLQALLPACFCSLYQLRYYKTVSGMDTVEKSGRYNHLTSSKSCL